LYGDGRKLHVVLSVSYYQSPSHRALVPTRPKQPATLYSTLLNMELNSNMEVSGDSCSSSKMKLSSREGSRMEVSGSSGRSEVSSMEVVTSKGSSMEVVSSEEGEMDWEAGKDVMKKKVRKVRNKLGRMELGEKEDATMTSDSGSSRNGSSIAKVSGDTSGFNLNSSGEVEISSGSMLFGRPLYTSTPKKNI